MIMIMTHDIPMCRVLIKISFHSRLCFNGVRMLTCTHTILAQVRISQDVGYIEEDRSSRGAFGGNFDRHIFPGIPSTIKTMGGKI